MRNVNPDSISVRFDKPVQPPITPEFDNTEPVQPPLTTGFDSSEPEANQMSAVECATSVLHMIHIAESI